LVGARSKPEHCEVATILELIARLLQRRAQFTDVAAQQRQLAEHRADQFLADRIVRSAHVQCTMILNTASRSAVTLLARRLSATI
jgi:hypothetical protein